MTKTTMVTIPAELWAKLEALSKQIAEILPQLRQAGILKTVTKPLAPPAKPAQKFNQPAPRKPTS